MPLLGNVKVSWTSFPFCNNTIQILSKAPNAAWELLEYILITGGDSTILLSKEGIESVTELGASCLTSHLRKLDSMISASFCHVKGCDTCLLLPNPECVVSHLETLDLKRKTWMGWILKWSGKNLRWSSEDFARRVTERDVGRGNVGHWDLKLLLPCRGDRHPRRMSLWFLCFWVNAA